MGNTDTITRNGEELKYLSDWYDAIEINRVMIPDSALATNEWFDANRKADKAHTECAAHDHDAKLTLAAYLDEIFSKIKYPEMNLPENETANVALAMALNTALLDYESL